MIDDYLRNQHIGWDTQVLVQSSDHGLCQEALAAQDFMSWPLFFLSLLRTPGPLNSSRFLFRVELFL